jgi:hypothetical protein
MQKAEFFMEDLRIVMVLQGFEILRDPQNDIIILLMRKS